MNTLARLRRTGLAPIALLVSTAALAACSKGHAAPEPPAPQPAPAPDPTPAATAAAKPAASPCPPATTKGTGTSADPCLATGATRMIQLTWTGKIGERPEFSLKNLSGRPITNISSNVFFYDKAGKMLLVKKLHMVPGLTGGYKLGANETKTQEMGAVKADVPPGAAAIEAEAIGVQFDTGEFGKDVYWANYELSPYERPKGGLK